MTVKVKICGLKTKESVDASVEYGASYLGFVFFPPSPRNILGQDAHNISKDVPSEVKKVSVMVNPEGSEIEQMLEHFSPDYIQLHGDESPEVVDSIKSSYGVSIIKAISVRSGDDIAKSGQYLDVADMLLFDAKAPESLPGALPGGNGLSFNWNLLSGRDFGVPWMLSGGLNSENIAEAVSLTGADIVDVSSSVETSPGQKDLKLIKEFLEVVSRI